MRNTTMTRPANVKRSRPGRDAAVPTAVLTVCLLMFAAGRWSQPADGAHVLAIETVAAKSHWNFMKGVLRALVDGGHRVTVYTPFPEAGAAATENYTEVDISSEYESSLIAVNMDTTLVTPLFERPSFLIPFMANGSRFMCDVNDKVLAGRSDNDRPPFDVFITEPLSSECVSHGARRLGIPLIYTIPAPLLPWIETGVFGHYVNPAYVSHLLSAYTVPDTFYRRLCNVGLHLYTVYEHYRAMAIAAATEHRYYDRAPPVKPSLVFVNTHHITEMPRPVPITRVDVGGIHLKTPEPLPADILKFIDDSPHGVIYFTFGTVVSLSTIPNHIQQIFKDVLAGVPQRVLMKYEGEMKDKPENIMISKWLPQRDILLHPKIKLFIGHGGISGVYEAVDAGVPVIGFPFFYDQPRNIQNLVNAGMAISLDLMTLTKEKLLNTINEVMNNESYSKNAKIVSERFKDRPMTPAESVVYWTEYVIRHKGAPHLKSHALNLTWYQFFLLDVIAVVLSISLLIVFVIYKGFQFIKKCVINSLTKAKSKPE